MSPQKHVYEFEYTPEFSPIRSLYCTTLTFHSYPISCCIFYPQNICFQVQQKEMGTEKAQDLYLTISVANCPPFQLFMFASIPAMGNPLSLFASLSLGAANKQIIRSLLFNSEREKDIFLNLFKKVRPS